MEIELLKKIVKKKKFKVEAVYIGGGTPTSIPHELFKKLIKKCKFGQKEFTVEAGRPDTIDIKKVKIMKRYGVTRVSVNPQSFNERTLKAIGRGHSIEDIIKAYNLCRKHFIVNMDLIAMLPGEGFDDFKFSVDKAVELNPENISIHTLYLKKGSKLKVEGYEHEDAEEAKKMTSYAVYKLKSAGYVPYYMYRQKYTAGNLENVGYSKPDKICKYNIDIMEENTSILAAGANAISKKFTNDENLIERQAHVKEPGEYINRFDEIIKKTKEFWDYDK
ncbi:MAG: radical SAM protein [Clostridiales bacterium]|nr:radical SAM protein [Clostridiales bacterium]